MYCRHSFLLVLIVLVFTAAPDAGAQEKLAAPEQIRFFETSIRPLLVDQCQKCHGPHKQKADLRLDARAFILQGGASGPAAVPGHPEKSLLIKAVRHIGGAPKMPDGKMLSDREIADLARWVQMGLPYPEPVAVPKADPKIWWAFQIPRKPEVPKVHNTAWPQSPLDHFILAKLEAKGLTPAPPADRRTLLRRATFDLIGLPPTPDEIDAFVKDRSPSAFARVVDRLLASPHYGERWGRHWLDVARYADSNGLDENVAFGNAWRYRDYVVGAFNDDLPFDQFVLEQLAGDLLDSKDIAVRHRRLIATGFLSLGPKVIAEVDEKKMEMDIVDEQIDTVGRAFLGLTLGCARCHDHKFDPIPIADYYGLAGIFRSTKTMDHFKKIARWHEHPLASANDPAIKAAHESEIARQKATIEDLLRKPADETKDKLKRLRADLAKLEKAGPTLPTAMGVADGTTVDTPIHPRGNHLKIGKMVPRHVPVILTGERAPSFDARTSGRLELACWLVQPDHPLTSRVMVNRLWRWHFGHGIVRSTDNFGTLGELPSDQLLLDWLASRFVEGRWSIKAMHRSIMLSSTYQMSANADPKAREADPENRLHGRANVRRLEAEAIRDALLAVGGVLDKSQGGSMLHVKNREYLFDHTSKDTTNYDSRRRSLYLPVIRNNVYDVFQLFDFPDPAAPGGDRATTTVAPQALFMMNSELTMKICDHLVESLLKEAGLDDAGRVRRLYLKAYGREATDAETARAIALVRAVDHAMQKREPNLDRRRLLAWSALCQVIVSANEFVYVQ
jgi:mono/diheme cytochrome c family protein/cytochrome c553